MNAANLLTVARMVMVAPIVVLLVAAPGAPRATLFAFACFVLAALTDLVDGWVARRFRLETKLGQFMDPIADKLLIASTLLVLCANGVIEGWWILAPTIIVAREIAISGLRESLARHGCELPVSGLTKAKTHLQVYSAAALILVGAVPAVERPALLLLVVAAFITAVTGYNYIVKAMPLLKEPPRK